MDYLRNFVRQPQKTIENDSSDPKYLLTDASVLDVSGSVTPGEGGVTLRDAIHETLKTGTKRIVLDPGGVGYMDSSDVGELTAAYTSARNKECELKLLHLTRKIDDLMQITKLATMFDLYLNEQQALSSFKN